MGARSRWRATAVALALLLPVGVAGASTESAAEEPSMDGCVGTAAVDRYIVTLDPESSETEVEATSDAADDDGATVHHVYDLAIKGFAATLTDEAKESLEADPDVESIEADSLICATDEATATTTQTGAPWGLDRVDQRALPLSGTFAHEHDGAGIRAYVIDSGIKADHSEFATGSGSRVVAGINFATGESGTDDGSGHGTHVAGILGGKSYGVAKGVTLVPVRVLNRNASGSTSDIVAGINWVLQQQAQSGAPRAVANLSLGGGPSSAMTTAVTNLVNGGVPTAVSAGNDTASACTKSPADSTAALTVAATTTTDARADYSNYGSCVDVFAPGSAIPSAFPFAGSCTLTGRNGVTLPRTGSTTQSCPLNGTSMAAPHVAGVAAAYLQAVPGASASAVGTAVKDLATPGVVSDRGTSSPDKLLFSGLVADLGLAMSAPSSVAAGDTVTYTLTATNHGATPTGPVAVNVTVPAAPYTAHTRTGGSGGSCPNPAGSPTTIICTITSLAAGASATITLSQTAPAIGPLTPSAVISGPALDLVASNNTAGASTAVVVPPAPSSDLGVTGSAAPASVTLGTGATVSYTFTVTNAGPSTAPGASLSIALPADQTGSAYSNSAGTCTGTTSLTCSLGTLASGGSATVTVTRTPGAAGAATADAIVSAAPNDPNPANDAAEPSVTVNPASADLGLTASATPGSVTTGAPVTYTFVTTNAGPSAAPGASLKVTLPTGLTGTAWTNSAGSCTAAAPVVCSLGTLASGGTATVTLTRTPTTAGTATASATASATPADANPGNNTDVAWVTVTTAPPPTPTPPTRPRPRRSRRRRIRSGLRPRPRPASARSPPSSGRPVTTGSAGRPGVTSSSASAGTTSSPVAAATT